MYPLPRSTPEPTPKPNAKPSKAPTSRSPPSPCPTGQQTRTSSNGSTDSASNTTGLCGRNQHARLCYQGRCCFRPHNTAVHIMPERVWCYVLGCQGGAVACGEPVILGGQGLHGVRAERIALPGAKQRVLGCSVAFAQPSAHGGDGRGFERGAALFSAFPDDVHVGAGR